MIIATIDPWILAFSAVTVIVTIWMGFWSAKKSKTASDFFVAGRSVSVGWNASAISGEYLSAASFMGIAGMVMSSGYDALWYPVCYACGYLFLLLFIAGPLRRFGAYTIPDFAEGRFDSPLFRKIAVVFVLFIGFFYTMPQMKGAGTTLAYIFPGLPYWVGVVLVGAVITLNVALGGMKGITLVQAFQYWAKMFAISVPIFVLMAVYGHYGKQVGVNGDSFERIYQPASKLQLRLRKVVGEKIAELVHLDRANLTGFRTAGLSLSGLLTSYGAFQEKAVEVSAHGRNLSEVFPFTTNHVSASNFVDLAKPFLEKYGFKIVEENLQVVRFLSVRQSEPVPRSDFSGVQSELKFEGWSLATVLTHTNLQFYEYRNGDANVYYTYSISQNRFGSASNLSRKGIPTKAPSDETWLNPFGPLTTKAARALKPTTNYLGKTSSMSIPDSLAQGVKNISHLIKLKSDMERAPLAVFDGSPVAVDQLLFNYAGAHFVSELSSVGVVLESASEFQGKLITVPRATSAKVPSAAEAIPILAEVLSTNGITVVREGNHFKAFPTEDAVILPVDTKPYALLYTYSLIIALVCGTAGLPHILVRFYTNPDGVAAKRTTLWVMILIGIFYVFPPVFGVMGRNLMPELYNGVGAKGTDKIVLELPRILNDRKGDKEKGGKGEAAPAAEISPAPLRPFSPAETNAEPASVGIPWGSILSGITCAGAFAAFMSTFSGLLVSMTGALAHDVYGRILRPESTPEQRLRAFKICAVLIGGIAILLGTQVEALQINFMVGQAFAIAAASYFPLLFMSVWWRGMTMRGAAIGMLTGGLLALAGITLTSFSDLKWLDLADFWAAHPLLRILCEQPAIWTVPLAITLMIVVSKLTKGGIPADVRMKMLVLHAPEKLGLKQEYIQEHHGH